MWVSKQIKLTWTNYWIEVNKAIFNFNKIYLFQSNIKDEINYLQDIQEDCFYTEQNPSMQGKINYYLI